MILLKYPEKSPLGGIPPGPGLGGPANTLLEKMDESRQMRVREESMRCIGERVRKDGKIRKVGNRLWESNRGR
jgi:hypothetical protein